MADVFSTAVTGLNVAQTALATIGQNVANANTPGYARQTVTVAPQVSTRSGGGYVGNGVSVAGVSALINPYLEESVTMATGQSAEATQYATLMNQVQSAISDTASGMSSNIAKFQSALGQAAANPSSIPARQLVITNAEALAQSLNNTESALQQKKQQTNQMLTNNVSDANSLLTQLGKLNDLITKSEPKDINGNTIDGQKVNDLRVQRQNVLNQLGQYGQVSSYEQSDGLTVVLGGATVVISNHASQLAIGQDPSDPAQLRVGIKTSGGLAPLETKSLGGKMGASLSAMNDGINPALAQINQYTASMVQAVNDQMQKGVNLYGSMGQPFFQSSTPNVINNTNNTGTMNLNVKVDAYNAQASDYQLNYSSSKGYSLTRLSDNTIVSQSANLPLNAEGLTIDGVGTVKDGDQFKIQPFAGAANQLKVLTKDPKQLAWANPVATSASSNNTSTARLTTPTITSGLPLDPNLTSPVSITFTSANTYTISGAGIGTLTNQPFTPGQTIAFNGWSTTLEGIPNNGDVFNIKGSTGASGDGSNANGLNKVLQGKSFGNGSFSLADIYANMQSDMGNKTALAQTNQVSAQSVLKIAQSQRESYSGVNLDQEASDLARWQQIYAANAQVMSVAQKLFESLMNQI